MFKRLVNTNYTKYYSGVFLLLVTIPIFFAGIFVYNSIFDSATGQIRTGIIVLEKNSNPRDMDISYMVMEINPIKNTMALSFGLNYFGNGTYVIAITLPYQIETISELASPPYPGNWSYVNRESGSLIIISYADNNSSQNVPGGVTVGKNLKFQHNVADKIYDTSSLDVPFRGYITTEISQLTQENKLVNVNEMFPTTLRVALPPHAPITATTHNPTEKMPGNDSDVWVYYTEEEFTPFNIQYSVPKDRANFQLNLLLSGVLLGGALSTFVSGVHSILDNHFSKNNKKEDNPDENCQNKEDENRSIEKDEKITEYWNNDGLKEAKFELLKHYDSLSNSQGVRLLTLIAGLWTFLQTVNLLSPEQLSSIFTEIVVFIFFIFIFRSFFRFSLYSMFSAHVKWIENTELKNLLKCKKDLKGKNIMVLIHHATEEKIYGKLRIDEKRKYPTLRLLKTAPYHIFASNNWKGNLLNIILALVTTHFLFIIYFY